MPARRIQTSCSRNRRCSSAARSPRLPPTRTCETAPACSSARGNSAAITDCPTTMAGVPTGAATRSISPRSRKRGSTCSAPALTWKSNGCRRLPSGRKSSGRRFRRRKKGGRSVPRKRPPWTDQVLLLKDLRHERGVVSVAVERVGDIVGPLRVREVIVRKTKHKKLIRVVWARVEIVIVRDVDRMERVLADRDVLTKRDPFEFGRYLRRIEAQSVSESLLYIEEQVFLNDFRRQRGVYSSVGVADHFERAVKV